jgi:hypothetical protein
MRRSFIATQNIMKTNKAETREVSYVRMIVTATLSSAAKKTSELN